MIDFKICETFDCIGFDLIYTGELSYSYKDDSPDVNLSKCFLALEDISTDIKPCLPKEILAELQEDLENYFSNHPYWQDKYFEANTGY